MSHDTRSRPSSPRRPAALLAALGLLAAGCASTPQTRFHTLLPAPAAGVARAAPALPAQSWELAAVTVPVQVDQPQLVVRMPDDTLAVLEYDRWIAPLGDEIRAALTQRIGAALAAGAAPAAPGKTWRIAVDVQRFDSAVGRYARQETEWAIRAADGSGPALRCRSVFEQPVTSGVPALAAGHRVATAQLGDTLAAALKAAAAGAAPGCAAAAGS
jgi:uncharacterized protein